MTFSFLGLVLACSVEWHCLAPAFVAQFVIQSNINAQQSLIYLFILHEMEHFIYIYIYMCVCVY